MVTKGLKQKGGSTINQINEEGPILQTITSQRLLKKTASNPELNLSFVLKITAPSSPPGRYFISHILKKQGLNPIVFLLIEEFIGL